MVQQKDCAISLPGLKRQTSRIVISFYSSYDKPCGKLAQGQNLSLTRFS